MNCKDIIGFPDYKIYPDGKIFTNKLRKSFMITQTDRGGYKYVRLMQDGKQKKKFIHRLLFQHFKPNEWNEDLEVDHINLDRSDNRLENLKMVTRNQNCQRKGNYSNNKSGHKHINVNVSGKGREPRYVFQKKMNNLTYYKYFKTLDEAVEFKRVFFLIHQPNK